MNKNLLKGLLYSGSASFWWGILGVIYFEYLSFVGAAELVVHRTVWTTAILLFTTIYFSKWNLFITIMRKKKKLFFLFLSGLLIFINWSVWIYAVVTNRIIDASFGYYIFPIFSILFGYIFFKEKLNMMRIISIFLVLSSIVFLLFSFRNIPWIGLAVALSWSTYNLIRKKINVDTDIGLFIESLFITPIALLLFYFLFKNNDTYFITSGISLSLILLLAGPMTVIPLFLYVRGVTLSGLGPTGMVFFITPTCQFLLGFFYYNEPFSTDKLISFIFIWIAVVVYLRDLMNKQ